MYTRTRLVRTRAWLRAGVFTLLLTLLGTTGCEPPPEPADHPCHDVWGEAPAAGRIHVDAAAEPGGDGSLEAPFADLLLTGVDADGDVQDDVDSGLEQARASGIRQVVLAAGEYPGSYEISDPWHGDAGLQLVGCGQGQTVLTAITGPRIVDYDDDGEPIYEEVPRVVLDVTGAGTLGVVIRDLTIQGGRRSVLVHTDAGSDGETGGEVSPVSLTRVTVADALRVGVLIDGVRAAAELVDVTIEDVQEDEEDGFGWGVAVQARASWATDIVQPILLDQVTVRRAHGVGVLVDGGWVELRGVTVEDTATSGGVLGRGVQLQSRSWGLVDGLTAVGNADAALHLQGPGRVLPTEERDGEELQPIVVVDSQLLSTAWAEVPDSGGAEAGDGLSASPGAGVPEQFLVELEGVELSGNPRAQLLVDGVTAVLGPDNIFGKGGTFPIASQGAANLTGLDGAPLPEDYAGQVEELSEAEALDLNADAIDLDDPSQ